ncbi:MAG: O-antigen ligase family protein [Bacteroidota bacterium]
MNPDFRKHLTFKNAYLLILLILLGTLPLSKYVASASQIVLVALWLIEGRFQEKWDRFRSRPALWIFLILFFIHLAGMLWTSDVPFGFHDLKLKLPLLLLPIVLGTMEPLKPKEMYVLLAGFVLAVIIGTLFSLSIMLGFGPSDYTSDRETSLFISHIRFALMIDISIFILFFYLFTLKPKRSFFFLLSSFALYLIVFLLLFKSLTGLVVLILGGMLLAIRWSFRQKELMARWFVIVGVVTLPVLVAFYLSHQWNRFHIVRDNIENLEKTTVNGNFYWHDLGNPMTENGWRVGLYQCEPELRDAWNKVSTIGYDGLDQKNQELKYTLIRYLTSLGLRKDAYGVSQLTRQDINLIEKGFANSLYREPKRLRVRIYETIWEIDQYRNGANPSGHSIIQRIEYLKTGWAIFLDHPLAGVGTGDTQQAFDQKYEELKSPLDEAWRYRAHNQFLSFLIAFGLTGFILILAALILPAIVEKRFGSYFVLMFFITAMLSFLNEDTLETQAGVAFFALFYTLFVFGTEKEK